MTDDILSREEVEALLRGVVAEETELHGGLAEERAHPYAFGSPGPLQHEAMRALDAVNRRFADLLGARLSRFFGCQVRVVAQPVVLGTYADGARAAAAYVHTAQLEPEGVPWTLWLEPALVACAIDALYGGGQISEGAPLVHMTPLAARVADRLTQAIAAAYANARGSDRRTLRAGRTAIESRTLAPFAAAERMAVTEFAVEAGCGTGNFRLWIPYAIVDRALAAPRVGESGSESQGPGARMGARLRDTQVQLSVRLASAMLDVRQLLALEPGDVISLELPDRVSAEVEGVPMLECGYGVVNGHYALRIERVITAPWPGGGDGGQ